MKTSAYISVSTYLDTPLQTIFCKNFDPVADLELLRNVMRSRNAVLELVSRGDIDALGNGKEPSEILGNTTFSEGGLPPRNAACTAELVRKLKGSTCDLVCHYATETFGGGGWFTLNPSKIRWFDNDSELSPGAPHDLAEDRKEAEWQNS